MWDFFRRAAEQMVRWPYPTGDIRRLGWETHLMGYLRGLVHGAMAGAVLGVLYAPESGVAARRRVSRWLGQAEGLLADGQADPEPASRVGGRRRPASTSTEERAKRP
jgi:hypothetical protein